MLTARTEREARESTELVVQEFTRLACGAPVEISGNDLTLLRESRPFLRSNVRMYVSHVPGHPWDATVSACDSVRRARFEPVPHVPLRLLRSHDALELLQKRLRTGSEGREILLISVQWLKRIVDGEFA